MKMKLMKNIKYLQQKISQKVLIPKTTADFTSRVSKSYVPFTCKFPMVMHSVPILHRRCRSKTNFYVFSYDKISLKFCASFRFFLAVFMEKFPKIRYLSYVSLVCRRKKYFNLSSNNLWIIKDRDFIFGMHTHLMKPFQMRQRSIDLDRYLYTENSHFGLCTCRGIPVSRTHLIPLNKLVIIFCKEKHIALIILYLLQSKIKQYY